ncbi:YhdP family protein [Gilvimarinus xylanilyticus]|uniref:TIGR02099 family protein n=1 Tax=Gilvimarinus xylanilyticus TaxID=2944139 RepID=A0A9X2KX10_9GAMM|nr:YhdP family protein [Gilvimarinus xylanilyticus]MCP8900195.1 TIGR02099 family protein [Gilvimarinus xylanilyticus]
MGNSDGALAEFTMRRVLRFCLRQFYLLLAFTIITLAVLVQLARSLTPLLSDYREPIAELLSEQTGTRIEIGALEAEWSGMRPLLQVDNIRVHGQGGELLLEMSEAQLSLDLIASAWQLKPVWSGVTLRGGALALLQDETGHWRLRGARASRAEPLSAELQNQLLDILLAARRIGIEQTQLDVQFASGHSINLQAPNLLLENRGDFHRLLLQLGSAGNPNALYVLLESQGDPRRSSARQRGYVQVRDFPLADLGAALPRQWWQGAADELAGRLDASVWIDRPDANTGYSARGELQLADAELPLSPSRTFSLERIQADLSGSYHQGRWQLGLDKLFVAALGITQGQLRLWLGQDDPKAPLQVRLADLDVGWLNRQLLESELIDSERWYAELLTAMDLRGQMSDVTLSVPLKQPRSARLQARLEQVSGDGWKGIPALSGVTGYLHTGLFAGHVQLDTQQAFTMGFDKVYARPLKFDSAHGSVGWRVQPDANQVDVYSGKLQVSDKAERAEGQFHLSLPIRRNTGPIELTLAVTATDVLAGQYRKYLPQVVPQSLTEYLTRGIGRSNRALASRGSFIYRGTLNEKGPQSYSVGLDLALENGSFLYHPDWPELHDAHGRLVVDDGDVHARIERAQIYNSDITDIQLTLADNPDDVGKLLQINGAIDGIASDGLRILRQSVLRRFVGNQMDTWYLHGDLTGVVDLAIPLAPEARGAQQNLVLDVNASMFALDNFKLELEDFSGRIAYSSETGLRSESLQATLFNEPTEIAIGTRAPGTPNALTTIDVATAATAAQLTEWSDQPSLRLIEGRIPLDVHVELNHNYAQQESVSADKRVAAIGVQAELQEVSVALPAPLGKAAGEPGRLALNYILGAQTALADIHYRDNLRALLHLSPNGKQLLGGAINLGSEPELDLEPKLKVTASLAQLDKNAWLGLWQKYRQLHPPEASSEVTQAGLSLPVELGLTLGEHRVGNWTLKDLQLLATQQPDAWKLHVDHPQVVGDVFWPLDLSEPFHIHIDKLAMPSSLLGEKNTQESESDSTVERKPALDWQAMSEWRGANVAIESLHLGDADYGRWQFEFRPDREHLGLHNITGDIRGIAVDGLGDQSGASLRLELGETLRTHLTTGLNATDMGQVLQAWGAPASIQTETAQMQLELGWAGSPLDFELEHLSGQARTSLGEGRFIRTSGGAGEGLLRLLGLFNFDSLARRARLDFSDVYTSGLTFDHINGAVSFNEGHLHIDEPIQMQSPSGRMQLTGGVDLQAQTLNTHLVATIPMGGNLTVIAALAAGFPVAAGVFVLSKLFEDQMNKVTSLTYKVTGSWDDPQTEFVGVADQAQ